MRSTTIFSIVRRLLVSSCVVFSLACDDGDLEPETLRTYEDPAMRVVMDGPSTDTSLYREISGSNAPSTVEVRFEPLTSSEKLVGSPESLCNTPDAGEPLIFDVPVPADPSDPDTFVTLEIEPTTSGVVRIPVRIKRVP